MAIFDPVSVTLQKNLQDIVVKFNRNIALADVQGSAGLEPADAATGFTVEVNGKPARIAKAEPTAADEITLYLAEPVPESLAERVTHSYKDGNVCDGGGNVLALLAGARVDRAK